ncbi:hypothetical protein J4438_00300 [Candidatus Woesearchaeota archaeon]|nr:hypothetical protein [Candidatus Woesearchaeota archaeon]
MGIGKTLTGIVLAGGLLYGTIAGIGGCLNNYILSEGSRIGQVNKLSQGGVFWKTYEGTLALHGLSSQGANLWDFSIDRQARSGENVEQIATDIQRCLDSQELVKLTYKKPLAVWPWRANTEYLVQKIEPVEKK